MSTTRDEVLAAMAEAAGYAEFITCDAATCNGMCEAPEVHFAPAIQRALAAAEQAGWVLVPKRLPCPECSGEGYTALLYGGEEVQCEQCRGSGEIDVWAAMLNAAPKVTP